MHNSVCQKVSECTAQQRRTGLILGIESVMGKLFFGDLRPDKTQNRPSQLQRLARDLKFQI